MQRNPGASFYNGKESEMAESKTTEQRVIQMIAEQLGLEDSYVTSEKRIVADLGADSLDRMELVIFLEDEFSIQVDDYEVERVETVADAIALVNAMLAAREAA